MGVGGSGLPHVEGEEAAGWDARAWSPATLLKRPTCPPGLAGFQTRPRLLLSKPCRVELYFGSLQVKGF